MTQDEIIRMAREAGYQSVYLSDAPIGRSYQFLERFAALVAAHEREKQAEQEPVAWVHKNGLLTDYGSIKCGDTPLYYEPTNICQNSTELVEIEAAAIRARGENASS